jgi:hypothetical protein
MPHRSPVEVIPMTLDNRLKIWAFVIVTIGLSGCGKPGYCTDVDEYAKKMKIERSLAETKLKGAGGFVCANGGNVGR